MRHLAQCLALAGCLSQIASAAPLQQNTSPEFKKLISELASKDRQAQEAAIVELGKLGDSRAIPALTALRQGSLFRMEDDRIVIVPPEKEKKKFLSDGTETAPLIDVFTGVELPGLDGKPLMIDVTKLKRVVATNALKMKIAPVLSRLSLSSPDSEARMSAAIKMGADRAVESIPLLEEALKLEKDRWVRQVIDEAIQMIRLTDPDAAVRLAAVRRLGELDGSNGVPFLKQMVAPGPDGKTVEADRTVADAARTAIKSIESHEALTRTVSTTFEVLSLSSVLMLVALGLAITFGVMGVINMAHGEMVMIGAYATYAVQTLFQAMFPAHPDAYFVFAIPASFVAAAALGLLMERTLLQRLYGRPLESMLATWGISLVLQQAVKSVFGDANVDIKSPSFLSGGLPIMSGLTLSYNRIFIFAFSFLCLLGLYLILWRSPIGLRIRAVTQNRAMSSCLGVATGRVDAFTFAMGAGVAGLAGCAMSQVGTVGPGMGQTYIVDAFMVVVLGGVGKLLGTVVAAFGIGGVNKILETVIGGALPKWGPTLSKVAVLALVILVLQKKPSGFFAIKGRHAES
jgi:urea transport system permease protein